MTTHHTITDQPIRCLESGSSSVRSRVSMTEVQICGVPKLLARGVAPTS